jgi:hypothetical protein
MSKILRLSRKTELYLTSIVEYGTLNLDPDVERGAAMQKSAKDRVYNYLRSNKGDVDTIARRLGLSTDDVRHFLGELETEDLIKQPFDGMYEAKERISAKGPGQAPTPVHLDRSPYHVGREWYASTVEAHLRVPHQYGPNEHEWFTY